MAANAEAGAGAANNDVARTVATAAPTMGALPVDPPPTLSPTLSPTPLSTGAKADPAGTSPTATTDPAAVDGGSSAPASTAGPGAQQHPGSTSARSKPPRRQRIWRGAARGIALLAVAITVMMIALAIGMRSNDSAIDEHLGTATATVLSVSPLRTGIEFVDVTGATIRPEGGVLYPGLLSLGQQFVVEYSTQDPQIARVAGRTASVGTIMIVLTLAGTYLIAAPLIWWCRRRSQLPLLPFRRDREPFGAVLAGTDRGR